MIEKYLILGSSIVSFMYGMENAPKIPEIYTLCEWNKNHAESGCSPIELAHRHILRKIVDKHDDQFKGLLVFNVVSNEGFAAYLASITNAGTIHSTDEEDSTDITHTQFKYKHIPNLFFTQTAHQNTFDIFTTFQLPSKENSLRELLLIYKKALKTHGKVFGSIITQSNEDSIEQLFYQQIYEKIYNTLAAEDQNRIEKTIYSKDLFITQETLEKVVNETGYEITSQVNRFFHVEIKDTLSFKKMLKIGCSNVLSKSFKMMSSKDLEDCCNIFLVLVLTDLQEKNKNSMHPCQRHKLIYPYNVTEIHLRKK